MGFPAPASGAGSDSSARRSSPGLTFSGSGTSRSGALPSAGSTVRSTSGPSAARFGLDRSSGSRGTSSGRTGGLSTRTVPSADRGDTGRGVSSGGSSRGIDGGAILDRYGRGDRAGGSDSFQGGLSSGRRSGSSGRNTSGERSGGGTARGVDRAAGASRGGVVGRGDDLAGRGRDQGRPDRAAGGSQRSGDGQRGGGLRGGGAVSESGLGGQSGRSGRGLGDANERGVRSGRKDLTRPLRDLAARNPRRAREIGYAGDYAARGTRSALRVGLRTSLGVFGLQGLSLGYGYWDNGWGFYGGFNYFNPCYYGNYWYWWSLGSYRYSYFAHPFSYPYYSLYGCWPRYNTWYPSNLYYSYPAYTASVITRYVYDDYDYGSGGGGDTYVYVNDGDDVAVYDEPRIEPYQEPAGGGQPVPLTEAGAVQPDAGVPAPADDSSLRAGGQYLTLGDQAFRDGRYADAVHFYARAAQFAPEDGVVWLVLSDGLFATGDYHYGAYALRKALELDAGLARGPVDKRTFYTDGNEFDRQLAVLENFVADHPGDGDAVLMLAANYLFGGRPAAAVDLLEGPGAEEPRNSQAGSALLEAARAIQYGR